MDANEFRNTVMPLGRRMHALALRLTGNADDADDAVQDTLERLWRRRDTLGHAENRAAYCMTALRNCCLDMLAERKPRGEMPADTESADDTAAPLEAAERARQVRAAIASLPEQQARIVTLRDLRELSVEEICSQTGLTPGNVRTLLCRGRLSIRKHFCQHNRTFL